MSKEKLTGLLEYMARSLAKNPDEVRIVAEEDDNQLTLRLTVAQDDMGRVIGKGGKTAKAIRSLVKAASDPKGKKVSVDITD